MQQFFDFRHDLALWIRRLVTASAEAGEHVSPIVTMETGGSWGRPGTNSFELGRGR